MAVNGTNGARTADDRVLEVIFNPEDPTGGGVEVLEMIIHVLYPATVKLVPFL